MISDWIKNNPQRIKPKPKEIYQPNINDGLITIITTHEIVKVL